MNMHFLPGSDNLVPELEEEDPARRGYLKYIHQIRSRALGLMHEVDIKNDNIGCVSYLRQRTRLMIHLNTILESGSISEKIYIKLAGLQNGDILYHENFKGNLSVKDAAGKTIEKHLSDNSTW